MRVPAAFAGGPLLAAIIGGFSLYTGVTGASLAESAAESVTVPAARPTAAAPAQGMFYVAQHSSDDWFASSYMNHSVYGPGNEKLGTITDLLMTSDGRAAAAIVGVGGFLGIGEKDVAINLSALKAGDKGGAEGLFLDVSKDQLKRAPKYVKLPGRMQR